VCTILRCLRPAARDTSTTNAGMPYSLNSSQLSSGN
jgi:hypothetical protein